MTWLSSRGRPNAFLSRQYSAVCSIHRSNGIRAAVKHMGYKLNLSVIQSNIKHSTTVAEKSHPVPLTATINVRKTQRTWLDKTRYAGLDRQQFFKSSRLVRTSSKVTMNPLSAFAFVFEMAIDAGELGLVLFY